MKTDELYIRAEEDNIAIIYSVPLPKTKSISTTVDGDMYIGIDQSIMNSSAEERVHLAHEIGHCETGAFYSLYSPIDNRQWCENKANKRAYELLISQDELIQLIEASCGEISIWELAEHFNVTEEFMRKAVEFYYG